MSHPRERTVNTGAIRTEWTTPSTGTSFAQLSSSILIYSPSPFICLVEPQSPEKPTESEPSSSALREESASVDGPSFDTYRKSLAERLQVAETLSADAEDIIISVGLILIFTYDLLIWPTQAALLAATVAVFTGASVPGLKPNPRETSMFYLARASEIFANTSGVPIKLPYMPPDPAEFTPSRPALWLNSLWFMSLAISISCILLASSMQRWALRYGRTAPDSADQSDELRVTWLVVILPVSLRIAVSFFYAGFALLIFDSLRIYLGIWQALFLSATSVVGPVMLLLQTS